MRAPDPASPPMTIRMATLGRDAEAYGKHLVEHMAESGRGGSPHFALARIWTVDEMRGAFTERAVKGLSEPLWGRVWLLWTEPREGAPRVVGHVELRGGRLAAEMHRATLGVGILRAYTGQGHGRRLITTAVEWARTSAGLRWIDLGVFASNEPARRLYTRMGFVENGIRRDAFRLDAGVTVDDVQMALELRP